jgi:Ser/Thr protein kinase RdoA (MazF antagonist)
MSATLLAAPGRPLHPVAAGEPPVRNVPVRAIAALWGVAPRRVVRIGGDRNVHWAVDAADGRYLLRCYRADRDAAAIAYEAAVLAHLGAAGWPVAAPIGPTRDWDGRTYALFHRLPGRSGRRGPEPAAGQRRRGRLLARLHADLAGLALGQRSGWRRLDRFAREEAGPIAAGARDRLPAGPVRDALVRHAEQTALDLTGCPADLPRSVVHGDLVPWNLRWRHGELTGVLDFDDVRLDLRAADVALARRWGGDGVVAGYRSAAALSAAEAALLAPLWRAWTLVFAADLLRAPVLGPRVLTALAWCAREVQRTRPYAPDRT